MATTAAPLVQPQQQLAGTGNQTTHAEATLELRKKIHEKFELVIKLFIAVFSAGLALLLALTHGALIPAVVPLFQTIVDSFLEAFHQSLEILKLRRELAALQARPGP